MGKSDVAPWFRSASGTAPYCCSAWLANGSGKVAAAIWPLASIWPICGNGIGAAGNFTDVGVTPFSWSTETSSR